MKYLIKATTLEEFNFQARKNLNFTTQLGTKLEQYEKEILEIDIKKIKV